MVASGPIYGSIVCKSLKFGFERNKKENKENWIWIALGFRSESNWIDGMWSSHRMLTDSTS